MAYTELLVERKDGVGVVTLNRPDKLNAMTGRGWMEIGAAADELGQDPEVRAVLLTGAGRGFCAGQDLSDFEALKDQIRSMRPDLVCTPAIVRCPKPTIAAVNGPAIGGGLGLALAFDVRISSEQARFASIFIQRALLPDMGTTYLLPRAVGLAKALELMYTGDIIDAQEAYRIGLVNQVVPQEELMPTAMALAQRLAKGPPLALALTKRLAYQAFAPDVPAHCELEIYLQQICMNSDDFQEGVKSFFERRPPQFKGR